MKKQLDVEMIERLHEFGGLIAYKVIYFDPTLFKVIEYCLTFDENYASDQLKFLQERGFTAGMNNFLVKFNNAFLQKEIQNA